MTFRRLLGAFSVLFCIASGLLRALTLLKETDAAGFTLTGPLWLHYLLLAVPVVLMLLFSLAIPTDTCHRFRPAAGIPAFCGLLFSGAVGICLYALGHTGIPVLAAAVLMALGSLWFAGQLLCGDRTAPLCGVAAALGWLLVCILLFSGKAASLHHITHVLELLCCAGILLFLCGVLRAAYSDGFPGISRMVFFRGMLAFYLGICLLLPQELWLWKQGQPVLFFQGKCIGAALLGISGLVWALYCMCTEGEPAREEPETDPAAAFAEAERLLMEETAAAATDSTVPFAAPQPQRWSSAASALYGTAAPKVEPAPVQAESSTPKTETAAPKVNSAPAKIESAAPQANSVVPETTAPTVPPVSEIPAAPKEEPASAPKPEAAPARPASAMDRLDALLDTIGSAPKNDPIDTLLADLDQRPAPPSMPKAMPVEKWVFHRD